MGVPFPEGAQGWRGSRWTEYPALSWRRCRGDAWSVRAPPEAHSAGPGPWRPAQAVGPGTPGSWRMCPEGGWVPSSGQPCSGAEAVEIENGRSNGRRASSRPVVHPRARLFSSWTRWKTLEASRFTERNSGVCAHEGEGGPRTACCLTVESGSGTRGLTTSRRLGGSSCTPSYHECPDAALGTRPVSCPCVLHGCCLRDLSLIPAGTCWTGGPAPRFLTYESPACLRGVLGPLARVQREGGACEGRSR